MINIKFTSSKLLKLAIFGMLVLTTFVYGFNFNSNEANAKVTQISSVPLYKTPNDIGMKGSKAKVQKDALIKYKSAMGIIREYYKKKGVILSNDLDDELYVEHVNSLALDLDSFTSKDSKKVEDFVYFIGYYSNFETNARIKVLNGKLKNGTLTEEESTELDSYRPADKSETQNGISSVSMASVTHANGYNSGKAVAYATKWTSNSKNLRNNKSYPYYKNVYKCNSCWNDCTNFVSQAIRAGGMKYRKGGFFSTARSNDVWYYKNSKPSHSWGGAHNFYKHWKDRAGVAKKSGSLRTGDVVSIDFQGDGKIDHTVIITKTKGTKTNQQYYTQHTTDAKNKHNLAYLYKKGYTLYGFEMDKAKN